MYKFKYNFKTVVHKKKKILNLPYFTMWINKKFLTKTIIISKVFIGSPSIFLYMYINQNTMFIIKINYTVYCISNINEK